MSFPPCPGCGAITAPGDIGTVHRMDCSILGLVTPKRETMSDINVTRTPRTTTEISITQHHNEPLIATTNGSEAVRLWRQSITTSGIVVTIPELKALIQEYEKPAGS